MKINPTNKFAINSVIAAITVACGAASVYIGVTVASDDSLPVVTTPISARVAESTAWSTSPILANTLVIKPLDTVEKSMNSDVLAQVTSMADSAIPTNSVGTTEHDPFNRIQLTNATFGAAAITQLGVNLDPVAKWYGYSSAEFKQQLLSDTSMKIDAKGRVVYVDEQVVTINQATEKVTASVPTSGTDTPFSYDQTFVLHSKPDSPRALYINFTGQGTRPPFDLDNSPSTFNNAERLIIQQVWMRVAEVYSAFDVDVTTENPDTKIGSTILVTPQNTTIGGYAFLNTFGVLKPGAANALCFPNNLANSEKYIADCVAHEFGHTVGLAHQGQLPTSPYYMGQGSSETGWAPIMGVGYYKNLVQWSKGEYTRANNKLDAYSIMLKRGLPVRDAIRGSTITDASEMVGSAANGYNNLTATGIIRSPTDSNMFKFVAGVGQSNITVSPYMLGGTLHTSLQVMNNKGVVLATSTNELTRTATIKLLLPTAGTYYLKVTGRGAGDPLVNGYTNYGSIGQYTINAVTVPTTLAIK